jgi:hypothetical protein
MKSYKNIARVVTRKSFPDFLKALNYRVDVKEWSEVGGTFEIVRKVMHVFDADYMYDVGCGKYPT